MTTSINAHVRYDTGVKMKVSLQPALEHEFTFVVPENKIVPALNPEFSEFNHKVKFKIK
jgi:hypothetical protein